jgi:hypothetical protein
VQPRRPGTSRVVDASKIRRANSGVVAPQSGAFYNTTANIDLKKEIDEIAKAPAKPSSASIGAERD